jgi:hypothetical protein
LQNQSNDPVAQLVEHYTFNVGVLGSNPSGITPNNRRLKIKNVNDWFLAFFIFEKPHFYGKPSPQFAPTKKFLYEMV